MLPVLRILSDRPWRTGDLVPAMATEFRLTESERTQLLGSGRQTVIANRTHWALAYLHKAGLVMRVRRGEYDVTPSGRELLKAPPDRITLAFLTKAYAGVRSFRGKTDSAPGSPVSGDGVVAMVAETPRETLDRAAAELRAALVSDLLEQVRAMDPSAFEQLIVDLMLAMGFGGPHLTAGQRLGRTGDGGVDGVIRQDALGLDVIYLQAKRYAGDNTVGAPVIQTFAGALLQRGAMKGVFVTTSSFSAQAKQAVSNFGSHKIVLIDGEELARLMIEHEVGVRTVQTIKVQRVDLEAYAEDDA